MIHTPHAFTIILLLSAPLTGCADLANNKSMTDYGTNPNLPPPQTTLIPTVSIAPAKGWPTGGIPVAAPGLAVHAFATGLNHPRMLHVLPNGDVLVAESNAPAKPDGPKSIRDRVMKSVMKRAGAGVESADQITLLRDTDGDGVADVKTIFLADLHSPFGMALVKDQLFVANTDAIMRFTYRPGEIKGSGVGTKVLDLPALPINHHWTKDLIANNDGTKLYVTVGSNSNIGENGMDKENGRAAIWEFDLASKTSRIFASGLRNPNGLAWQPQSGVLWVAVNERDELGNDLVPDYITSVRDGAFYGWPYSYYGHHIDERVTPQQPELVAKAIAPDYAVGAHTAPLGMIFYDANLLPQRYAGGAFVSQHGSWNRKPRSGYKVIYVPFKDGEPNGLPTDVLSGFLNADGDAQGRPVGLAIDRAGALLVADDVGNTVWRVTPALKMPVSSTGLPGNAMQDIK